MATRGRGTRPFGRGRGRGRGGNQASGFGPQRKRGPQQTTTKLFIGSLPETVRIIDLQNLFEQYGEVVECDIVKDYAFVHFINEDEAKEAVANLDGYELNGSNIKVEFSRSSVRQQPGMGNKDECFRCGKTGHWTRDCPTYPQEQRGSRPPRGGASSRSAPYPSPGRPAPYPSPARDPYREPARDPYREPTLYSSARLPPPPPPELSQHYRRFSAYERSRLRDMYDNDPFARPPPDYYASRTSRERLYDNYYRDSVASLSPLPQRAGADPWSLPR